MLRNNRKAEQMKVEWKPYEPYSGVPREGWIAQVGKLEVRVYQEFRLFGGKRRWTGMIHGCNAWVKLLNAGGPQTADEAKEQALKELEEIIQLATTERTGR